MIVQMPEDMGAYENKPFAHFTKRQLIFFPLALIVMVVLFIVLYTITNNIEIPAVVAFICGFPVVMCAIYKRNGMYFDAIVKGKYQDLKMYPRRRSFVMHNLYEDIILTVEEENRIAEEIKKAAEQESVADSSRNNKKQKRKSK